MSTNIQSTVAPALDTATARTTSTKARRVLFAWSAPASPICGLLKAEMYAHFLNAELFVMALIDARRGPSGRELSASCREVDGVRRFLDRTLPGKIDESHLLVRQGAFAPEVERAATELGAELIVIPPSQKKIGKQASQIAEATGAMVLVARLPRMHNTVVAATDLSNYRYPVVNVAQRVRHYLSANLVLIHNMVPEFFSSGSELLWPTRLAPTERALSQVTQRLRGIVTACGTCAEAILASERNTAHAILHAARDRDADLVVVGARPRSRWEQFLDSGVAARVVRESKRSVLIVPFSQDAQDRFTWVGAPALA